MGKLSIAEHRIILLERLSQVIILVVSKKYPSFLYFTLCLSTSHIFWCVFIQLNFLLNFFLFADVGDLDDTTGKEVLVDFSERYRDDDINQPDNAKFNLNGEWHNFEP